MVRNTALDITKHLHNNTTPPQKKTTSDHGQGDVPWISRLLLGVLPGRHLPRCLCLREEQRASVSGLGSVIQQIVGSIECEQIKMIVGWIECEQIETIKNIRRTEHGVTNLDALNTRQVLATR